MKSLIAKTRFEPGRDPGKVWELYHENSKIDRNRPITPNELVVQKMMDQADTIDYRAFATEPVATDAAAVDPALARALQGRVSGRDWALTSMTRAELDTLLHLSYGITRETDGTDLIRPARVCPSGGAMYPLEIYLNVRNVDGLDPGLYHYNPRRNVLERLREGDPTFELSPAFVQRDVIEGAACVWLVTALFERTTFKYGNRGYRFALIEAGHLAQNANVVATAMNIGVLNMGGFFDRDVDAFLGIDGLNHSTLYALAFGKAVTA